MDSTTAVNSNNATNTILIGGINDNEQRETRGGGS